VVSVAQPVMGSTEGPQGQMMDLQRERVEFQRDVLGEFGNIPSLWFLLPNR
jgi:hypothetical protein